MQIMKYIPFRLLVSLPFAMVFIIYLKTESILLPFILGMACYVLLLIYFLLPFIRRRKMGVGQQMVTLRHALGTVTEVLKVVLVVFAMVLLIGLYIIATKWPI